MSTLGTGTGFERLHYLLVEAFETPILPFPFDFITYFISFFF